MKEYDVIIIGSGAGLNLVSPIMNQGLQVALVEDGPLGGTCLNRGCIPSKVMIHPADLMRETQSATRIGVKSDLKLDFKKIMERTRGIVERDNQEIEHGIRASTELGFFHGIGKFIDDYTIQIGDQRIRGKKIIIASGSRPYIPPVKGLEDTGFITSREVFSLENASKSLVIVGGGYIAVEFAHFFSAVGRE